MMKKISIIGLSFLLLFGITGCSEWLDLKPESEIILDEYWQSESDVESVLAACYRGLTEESVIYRMIVWGELRSDNMTVGAGFPSGRYDIQKILEGDIVSTNAYCSWGPFYSVINYCNTLLYYAPKVVDKDDNFTESDLHRVQAEALAIRSLCYFYLVRTFNEVPWMEEASISDSQNYNVEKQPEQVIINHIINDLLIAQKYARTDFGVKSYNKGRFTLDGVNALLADVYLWNQQYDKCIETCNLVLGDSKLKLEESENAYSHIFYLGNSTESIFELQFNEDVQKNTAVMNLYGTSGYFSEVSLPSTLGYSQEQNILGGYSPFNYKVSTTVTEGANDIRAKDSYRLYSGKYFIFKYAGILRSENLTTMTSTYYNRTNTPNWIVYRLPDIMLMKAEALVESKTGNSAENMKTAMNYVNKTYMRSNDGRDSLSIDNYPSKDEVAKLVLRERQRELLFEGKRWFDLVRLAKRENSTNTLNDYVDHKVSGNAVSLGAPVMDAMYMPIAYSELRANPQLKQNPYYQTTSTSTR